MRTIIGIGILLMSLTARAEYYPPLEYQVFGQPFVQSDKAAIDQLMDEFWNAWSAQDAKAVANTHAADAEWTNAFGRSFRGRKDLDVFLSERLFPMFDKEVSKTEASSYKPTSRRYIGSSAAVIYGRLESNRGSSVGLTNRKIAFVFVLEKKDEQWKITNQIITDLRERRGT